MHPTPGNSLSDTTLSTKTMLSDDETMENRRSLVRILMDNLCYTGSVEIVADERLDGIYRSILTARRVFGDSGESASKS